MDEDTGTWMRAIEALTVVSLLSLLTKKSGFRVTFRCYESCGEKRCGPVCISKTRTTLLACLQQLYQQIMDHHGEKCVAAKAADAVSTNAAEGGASALAGAASNVMDLMMRLSNTKARAVAANKVALEAEQAKDALEREVQALERAKERPRTEASSTKNAEGMKVDEDMWDLDHHRWEATRVRNLRNIELGSGSVVSQCVCVYFSLVSYKKKMCKKIIESPKTKCAKKS